MKRRKATVARQTEAGIRNSQQSATARSAMQPANESEKEEKTLKHSPFAFAPVSNLPEVI
jgi:hypothetical protein